MVSVAVRTVRPSAVPPSATVSLRPSSRSSSIGVKVRVANPCVSFAGMVTVSPAMPSKSVPACAVPPVAASSTSVSVARAAPSSVAVTVTCTPPPSSSTVAGSTASCTTRDARSLSRTATATSLPVIPSYPPPVAAWVTVAMSASPSGSSAASTVTVCLPLQFATENDRLSGRTVTSALSATVTATVTGPVGSEARRTV